MGWDVTLPQALAALAAWAVLSAAAAYYAVARLGAVQAVLAVVLRRALRQVVVPEDGSGAGQPQVRRTATGATL